MQRSTMSGMVMGFCAVVMISVTPSAYGGQKKGGQPETFTLTSTAFGPNGTIPVIYTCDGQDISPPLQWGAPPAGTRSLALIVDDPDAPVGTWVHWVLYNLPASARAVSKAVAARAQLPDGSRHGKNDWGRKSYGGPCPPSDTHRYFFKLYALDTRLTLKSRATKRQVEAAMQGHILAQTKLMGRYRR